MSLLHHRTNHVSFRKFSPTLDINNGYTLKHFLSEFEKRTRIDTSYSVTENKDISELKKIIFKENENLFESLGFDANQLRPWKVDISWENDKKLKNLEPL